jgi:hypothetical protein
VTLDLVLRLAGLSIVLLALFHVVLWRALGWTEEISHMSSLSARVFAVHTFFVAFVLCGLGLLSMLEPGLLLRPSQLARYVCMGIVAFWVARLLAQPLVFDRAMVSGWARLPLVRVGTLVLWAAYVAVYGAVLARQIGWA